jgi:hypothetical protein
VIVPAADTILGVLYEMEQALAMMQESPDAK